MNRNETMMWAGPLPPHLASEADGASETLTPAARPGATIMWAGPLPPAGWEPARRAIRNGPGGGGVLAGRLEAKA